MTVNQVVLSGRERRRLAADRDQLEARDAARLAGRYFVYRVHDAAGQVIYVGRSNGVARRLRAHASNKAAWIPDARSVSMFGPMGWDQVVKAERAEIARHQPRGNVALTARDWRPAVAWGSVATRQDTPRACPTCGSTNG